MAINSVPTTPITAATTSRATNNSVGVSENTIAGNFQTFLRLLTTQLKNQNPLDPLDTNQFTQQLVQFAQVEQQLKSNDQLAKLVALEQAAQQSYALAFVGQVVAVDGTTAPLANGKATWNLSTGKPCVATINIKDANGQTVYSTTLNMNAGQQPFVWNGRDTNGQQLPNGNYTISVTAVDANNQPVPVSVEIEALVDAADLSKVPPVLTIAGRDYTVDKVKRVIRRA
jgi:flagellar basal-body rod modification protein FlgD